MSVINQKNWSETVNLDFLKTVITEPLGTRHQPANHGEVLDVFKMMCAEKDVKIISEQGLLSPDNYKYVYVMSVNVTGADKDYVFNLGFVNYNNKQKSLTMVAGETIMVCSNECYSGVLNDSRRRHTLNMWDDIRDRFSCGFEDFDKFCETRYKEINRLKEAQFGESQLGNVVLNLHRHSMIGNTNIDRIIREWDNPTFDYDTGGETAWDFQNACTYVFKENINDPLQKIGLSKDIHKYVGEACGLIEE